jgi:hypothetical protein
MLIMAGAVMLSAQETERDYTVYDGHGSAIEDVMMDIILDEDLSEKFWVDIQNVFYRAFGLVDPIRFHKATDWFYEKETVQLVKYQALASVDVNAYFQPQPDDREARKYVMEMRGREYTDPLLIDSIKGYLYQFTIPYGPENLIFIVTEMTFFGETFTGTVPHKVLER